MEDIKITANEVDEQTDQDAQGVLNNQDDFSKYQDLDCAIQEIAIKDIKHYERIPDYYKETYSARPIVVYTPNGHFCIDGWDLVEEAKTKGLTSVECYVDLINTHSENELGIRKTEIRSKTRGGFVTYAELFRNTSNLFEMLKNSNENLRVFDHGGRRRGEGFSDNKDDDARHVLSKRLGKDRDTINKLISFRQYLNDQAIEFFIKEGVRKRFFENIQTKKNQLINSLKGEKASDEQISEQVSQFIRDQYASYKEGQKKGKEKTKSINSQQTNHSSGPQQNQESTTTTNDPNITDSGDSEQDNKNDDGELTVEEHNKEFGQKEEPISIPRIKREVIEVSTRLSEKINETDDLDYIEECIKEELTKLMVALSYIGSLKSQKIAA